MNVAVLISIWIKWNNMPKVFGARINLWFQTQSLWIICSLFLNAPPCVLWGSLCPLSNSYIEVLNLTALRLWPFIEIGSLRENQVEVKSFDGSQRTDVEAETSILWPPDAKNWLIGKDPDAEKDWSQEKGKTEDEMVGWHHWLNGHAFEQIWGCDEGPGSLACCNPWGCKQSDMT